MKPIHSLVLASSFLMLAPLNYADDDTKAKEPTTTTAAAGDKKEVSEEETVLTLASQAEFNQALDNAAKKGLKSFTFRIDNKKWRTNAGMAVKRSTWYDHIRTYGIHSASKEEEGAWKLTINNYKDSTLMLQAHLNSELLKGLTLPQRSALSEVQRRVCALTNKSMTDEEKVRRIHDDLVTRAQYDMSSGGNCSTIVLQNRGKCEAYARYMYLALTIAGIENHIIIGNAHGPHAWNIVKIGARWYHVDATWDDTGVVQHDYFMLSDAEISKDHSWNKKIYPSAEESDNAYFRKLKLCFTAYRPYWEAVTKAYSNGEKQFEAMLKPLTENDTRFKKELKKYTETHPDVRIMHYSQSDTNCQIVTLTFLQDKKNSDVVPTSTATTSTATTSTATTPTATTPKVATSTVITPTETKPKRPSETEDSAQDWISKEYWQDSCKDFDTDKLIKQSQDMLKDSAKKVKDMWDSAGLNSLGL